MRIKLSAGRQEVSPGNYKLNYHWNYFLPWKYENRLDDDSQKRISNGIVHDLKMDGQGVT